jgi:hypothetical protein
MWPPRLRETHAVMTVITSSAAQSNVSAILRFLQRTAWPIESAVVRLSEPSGVVLDSCRWRIGARTTLAEVASEIEQYIVDGGINVEATIVAHRYELGWSDVTGRFVY